MREIWRDIEGYEGMYQVSNLGRVKGLNRLDSRGWKRKEKIMKNGFDSNGYFFVNLSKNGNRKAKRVHALVAITFLDHTPDGTMNVVIDHIDNDKTNNRADNLQLVTQRKNASKDRKNKTSKYTGVSWSNKEKKWVAQIWFNKKSKYLGGFTCEYSAHLAYQKELKNLKK